MIIRIFTAKVPKPLQDEFSIKFKEISVPVVEQYEGLISLEIGGPSQWNPDEFVMVSRWQSEKHLIAFAGEQWNQPHIPDGMEKYIEACTLLHFDHIELSN